MERPQEQLSIDNFAGVRQLDLAVQPFSVLIGPQSVGKSITAKLLYFFRTIPRFLVEDALDEKPLPPEEAVAERFKTFFPLPAQIGRDCGLTYQQGNSTVHLERVGSGTADWKAFLPDRVDDAFSVHHSRRSRSSRNESAENEFGDIEEEAHIEYANALSEVFSDGGLHSRFIPSGRSFYAQVQANMASFFSRASFDPFLTEFGIYIARIRRRRFPHLPLEESTGLAARTLSAQLLNGEYMRVNNEDFINTGDGRRLPAALWSSGQQEVQPLAFVLQHHIERPTLANPLFIEEPEAHLFPASQRTITEFIALAFNVGSPLSRMFLTTHSPYILTTINNLLIAGQIYAADNPAEAKHLVSDLVPADRALLPGSVGAFYMDQNGCRSIMDEETGLIDANAIDEVSGSLNDTFEKLLDLQYHP